MNTYFGNQRQNSILKVIFMFFIIVLMISMSFLFNVIAHEFGHYMAAESFNLEPSMHFFDAFYDNYGDVAFDLTKLNSEPVAYVSFKTTENTWELFNVTISAFLMHFVIILLTCLAYLSVKKTFLSELLFLGMLIPTVLSIIINLNPFSPISDGSVLLNIILQFI